MTFEVVFPEVGVARLGHVRRVAGRALVVGDVIDGIMLARTGIARSRIELTLKPSGRSAHMVFKCPSCDGPCAVLFPTVGGALACAGCARHRTRHQLESAGVEWKNFGVDLEDRLLRTVLKKRHTTVGLDRLRRLAEEIHAGDEDRFEALVPVVLDVLRAVEVATERDGDGVSPL